MDSSNFDLYRVLQSGPYDEAGLSQVKRLLGAERRMLRGKNDLETLEQLIPMLQDWAAAAGGGWLSASALAEAAEIAELDLRNSARAEDLRSQAIETGRTASGMPTPLDTSARRTSVPPNLAPNVSTQPLPASERTQEVRTIELELSPSMLPAAADDAISQEIAQAEQVLEVDTSPERVRELADLYALRDVSGDREQAAQLYCTLGEVLGNPAGVAMLERALALVPDHAEAKALLMRYAVLPRRPVSSPKITVLGMQPRGIPQPPAASGAVAAAPPALPPLEAEDAAHITALSAPLPPPRAAVAAPSQKPALSAAFAPRSGNGPTLSGASAAAAKISSRPPAAARASARPPAAGRGTSQGFALTADDRAIAVETLDADTLPPLALAAAQSIPPLPAAEMQAPAALPERRPANDADPDATAAPEVLQLHGIPQVVASRPAPPQISSLTPVVRSDASELETQRSSTSMTRVMVTAGFALSAAAAFGLYLSTHTKDAASPQLPKVAPAVASAKPTAAASEKASAASQPVAPLTAAEPAEPSAEAPPDGLAEPPPRAAAIKPAAPAPLAPSHLPTLKLESAKLRGGKLSETQLAQTLAKAEPKLLACYAQALEHTPRIKGRVIYSFSVRTNGHASNIKHAGGSLRDEALVQCSVKVLETLRFPKPRKQAVQVKLPIQYKRS